MQSRKFLVPVLLGVSAFCVLRQPLNAWERKPANYDRCEKNNENKQRCQKEAEEDNQHDFEMLLSTKAFTLYNDFFPEQKQLAMDYADNNKMSPDDAVQKVYAENR